MVYTRDLPGDSGRDSVYGRDRPWQSYMEALMTDYLVNSTQEEPSVFDRRPPIANIGRTAKRYGYTVEQPTIDDVINVYEWERNRVINKWAEYDSASGYQGTSFPAINGGNF